MKTRPKIRTLDIMPDENKLTCSIKDFHDLTLMELYNIMHLRDVVFVVGQKITAECEVDGEDPKCSHLLLYLEDTLIGTARLFLEESPISVGRIAIHTDQQGKGYGTRLMEFIADFLGERNATMHAQAHLETWYASLGWKRVGEEFMEAEIVHVKMTKNQ